MGVVVSIRQRLDRVCSDCENAYLGPSGVLCRVYHEEIFDETVAVECPDFDPLPWAKSS